MVKSDRDRRVEKGNKRADRYKHQNAVECPQCGELLPTKWWLFGGWDHPTEYARRCGKCGFTVIRAATLKESRLDIGGFDPL